MTNRSSPRGKPKKYPLWPKLLLLVGSIVIALLAVEIFLRVAVPYKYFYKFPRFEVQSVDPRDAPTDAADPLLGPAVTPDEDCGYRLKRNMVSRLCSSEFDTSVVTNDLGLRNPPIGPKKGLRVLGLGDSFSMGWGVEADEAFLHVVQDLSVERHKEGLGQPLEVINGGVMGYHIPNCYGFLNTRGLQLQPDLVVLEFWANSIADNGPVQKPRLKSQRTTLEFAKALTLRSHVVMLLTECLRSWALTRRFLFAHGVLGRERADAMLRSDFKDTHVDNLKQLGDALARFKRLCDEHRIRLIVLLIPFREQVSPAFLQRAVAYNLTSVDASKLDADAPNEIMHEVTDRLGIRLVDPTAALRAATEGGKCYFDSYDVHLTVRGHRVVGQVLYDAIAAELAAGQTQPAATLP